MSEDTTDRVLRVPTWWIHLALSMALLGGSLARTSDRSTAGTSGQNTQDQWWQHLQVFTAYGMPPGVDDLVTVVGWGGLAELPDHVQWTSIQAARAHGAGQRFMGSISLYDATYETYQARPELLGSTVIDINGDRAVVFWESTPEQQLWWGNTNHPVWQSFIREQGRALVDAGVDGIVIDEVEGTAGSISVGGSFGEPDMSQFREYLGERYTAAQLDERWDIDDLSTFDYGEYIRMHGLASTWMDEPWRVPLYQEFAGFQRQSVVHFLREFIQETRQYAQTTYGREIAFTANVWALAPSLLIFADLLDYYTVEFPYLDYGYPPESQAIAEFKLARALGAKPAVNLASIYTNADLLDRPSSSTLMTLYIAEAYAAQGAMMLPYGIYAWNEARGPDSYYGDMSILVPTYRFIVDHAFAYEGLESLAEVAVLYPFATDLARGTRGAFRGLNYALLDSQVQYDIVAMGDDLWLKDTFSTASLAPYSLAFLPDATHLSDAQVDALLSWVSAGGVVVAWGNTGTHDEAGQPVNRPELETLRVPGVHSSGSGWWTALSEDLGRRYLNTHDSAVRQQLQSLVGSYADPVTRPLVQRTLNVLAYGKESGSQLIVHLINYNYSIDTDKATPTGPFTITMRVPDALASLFGTQVYSLRPSERPQLLNWRIEADALLSAEHPGMATHDILWIVPEDEARALADQVTSFLANALVAARSAGHDTSSLDDLLAQIDAATTASNHMLARQLAQEALVQLQDLMRVRVLFDEAHGERNTLSWERARQINPEHPEWVYFGALADAVSDDLILERNAAAPLDGALLADYQAVVLSAPGQVLTASELDALREYVRSGGGLLVLGDCGLDEPVNILTAQYGIHFDPHCVFDAVQPGDTDLRGDFAVTSFHPHVAVHGVGSMVTNWAESLHLSEAALPLAATDAECWQDANWNGVHDEGEPGGPFTVVAAYDVSGARVAVVADNSFQDDGFEWRGNSSLMRALLRWVARWRPPSGHRALLPTILR